MDVCGASSSQSSSLSSSKKYDVFLSFRGEDTRENFVSHLYAALNRKKIKTYIDDVSLERGDVISPALLEAIQKSRISVIVFSKNYASSSWCFSELVHILDCHREKKQMVVPIFYKVDPSHIRKQEGSYGDAFVNHEERFKDKMEMVQKWRAALTESANLSGWDSRVTRPESKLVEAIVADVLRKLNCEQSSNSGFEGLIGIDKHVVEVKSLISVCSPKVRIVGIWGMAGIGKTTLAQVLFHQLASQFEARCFVPNVREESQKGSLINLRNKLLADLLKEENLNVGTPSLGPTFVKERLQRTKVFIVLDDVNHVEQLNTFVGDRDQFSCESRIVITTRDAALLRDISADGMYEVTQLDSKESLQLFNSIALRGNSPVADYVELSKKVVRHTGGVPLAITVLGSHFRSLRSQTKEAWTAALEKLKVIPHDDIHNVLRVSFDALDNMAKDIFLDIACFFKGMTRDCVEDILNACGFFANNGIDALIDKALIATKDNRLWMHDLLQEMGRKIVCGESTELGERSRLWIAEDVCQVLENNEGTAKIQGIFLDLSKIGRAIHLEPTTFKNMRNLRLLKIYDFVDKKNCEVYLQHGLQYLPHSLRYLEWHKYPLKTLPPNFKPKNLVKLKMVHSQLEKLWDGVQDLKKLRCIDLRHSIHLNQIPDFSRAPNLEGINVKYCTSLHQFHVLQNLPSLVSLDLSSTTIEYLPPSIGSLNSLSELCLNDCTRLANLPSSVNKLNSLIKLELSGCSSLEKFPELPCNIQELDICGTAIKEVASSSIEGRFGLTSINMSDCKSLESLPTNIFRLTSLAHLDLDGCSKIQKLPEVLEPMKSLKTLGLGGTGIQQLPSSIGHLIEVRMLNLDKCKNLKSIPSSIRDIASLDSLHLSDCPKFESYRRLFSLFSLKLEVLHLDNSNLIEIPARIQRISKLKELYLSNCKNLRSLPELPWSLEILVASGCVSLEVVSYSRKAFAENFSADKKGNVEYSIFSDCLNLDKKAQENISIDFQLKVWRKTMLHKDDDNGVRLCYPGNEIPKWFNCDQSVGSSINIELQPQWHNSFLGFVVCALVDSFSDAQELNLVCVVRLKPNQGKTHGFNWWFNSVGFIHLPSTSNSNNVFMWYRHADYHECLDAEEASFVFSFVEWNESEDCLIESSKCQVKKCGIHKLYRQDLEKFKSEAIPDQPESSACETNNFDTHEPHPKRLKF